LKLHHMLEKLLFLTILKVWSWTFTVFYGRAIKLCLNIVIFIKNLSKKGCTIINFARLMKRGALFGGLKSFWTIFKEISDKQKKIDVIRIKAFCKSCCGICISVILMYNIFFLLGKSLKRFNFNLVTIFNHFFSEVFNDL
jgi:hypothetical protein